MKRILAVVLATASLLVTPCYAANVAEQESISVSYQGKPITIDPNTPLLIRNDRVLVPYTVFNQILQNGEYDKINVKANYNFEDNEVVMTVNGEFGQLLGTYTQYVQDYVIYKDGLNCFTGDVRSDFLHNVPYVSIRAFGGALVDQDDDPLIDLRWNNANREVVITRYKKTTVSSDDIGGVSDANN